MRTMNRCFLTCLGLPALALACTEKPAPLAVARSSAPVVYGNDDRLDPYQVSNAVFADAVRGYDVALMSTSGYNATSSDIVTFQGSALGDIQLSDGNYVCADERFTDQLTTAFCSGTLIGPDLILTAGHCVTSASDCASTRFAFGYEYGSAGQQTVTTDDIYRCAAIVAREQVDDGPDYAVLRTDRTVVGRVPAPVRATHAELPLTSSLILAGHPYGLPLKIAANAGVLDNRAASLDYFVTTTDSFGGNSGSGIFDSVTGEVVGILVRGQEDFVYDPTSGCDRVNVCAESGCATGAEDATYVFRALEAACAAGGGTGVPGCACGDGDCGSGETTVNCTADCGSECGDGVCNGIETSFECEADCGVPTASCLNRTQITATDQTITGTTTGTSDTLQPACVGSTGGREQVYEFTVATTTQLAATSTGFDTVLYAGVNCGSSSLGCNDDDTSVADRGSMLSVELSPGTYYLVVDGYGNSDYGEFSLVLDFTARTPLGTSCTTSVECGSGHCVDGVCCDTACGGGASDCQACSVAAGATTDGTCGFLPATTVCRAAAGDCDLAESCSGTAAACPANGYAPATTVCRASGCADGVQTSEALCSGLGVTCPDSTQSSCGGYTCGAHSCLTECVQDEDCATGRHCDSGVCAPLAGAGSECETSASCASGFCVDGVCCDTSCTAQCMACDVAEQVGSCTNIVGTPHGSRPACPVDSTCLGGTCVAWSEAGGEGGAAGSSGAAGASGTVGHSGGTGGHSGGTGGHSGGTGGTPDAVGTSGAGGSTQTDHGTAGDAGDSTDPGASGGGAAGALTEAGGAAGRALSGGGRASDPSSGEEAGSTADHAENGGRSEDGTAGDSGAAGARSGSSSSDSSGCGCRTSSSRGGAHGAWLSIVVGFGLSVMRRRRRRNGCSARTPRIG